MKLLISIGKNHILSPMITEQYLLFIQHLSTISLLCKYVLIETKLPYIIENLLIEKNLILKKKKNLQKLESRMQKFTKKVLNKNLVKNNDHSYDIYIVALCQICFELLKL
jgi:hypothetical protein